MRQTGDSLVATIDRGKHLCLNNMHVVVPVGINPSPSYLLGTLNSKLLNWFYHTLNPEEGEALAEVKRFNVAKLPIVVPDLQIAAQISRHDEIRNLVDRMLALHQQLAKTKSPPDRASLELQIAATDRRIDRLIYELYGLTEEEIRIVEGGTGQ